MARKRCAEDRATNENRMNVNQLDAKQLISIEGSIR